MATVRGKRSLRVLAEQWNKIAAMREEQIQSGLDKSANDVLAPAILSRIERGKVALDIGCGTGWLTARAVKLCKNIVGIDPSVQSIAIARAEHGVERCEFAAYSVEKFADKGRRFDFAFANMSASSAPSLESFFGATRALLINGSPFLLTIPHPCFWPFYWGYSKELWFAYDKEVAIESDFRIQMQKTELRTTHFHRPLQMYFSNLVKAGFDIMEMQELHGAGFDFPRFLFIRAAAR